MTGLAHSYPAPGQRPLEAWSGLGDGPCVPIPQVAPKWRGWVGGVWSLPPNVPTSLSLEEVPPVDPPPMSLEVPGPDRAVGSQGRLRRENAGWVSFASKTCCCRDRPW